jgi:hypothetical protein
VEPTPTFAPATSEDGMVAQVIGPEGGQLMCPSGATAMLTVPADVLEEPSTITIRPIADSKLPTDSGIRLLSGTAYDVTVANTSGKSVDNLSEPAILKIALPDANAASGAKLYRVAGGRLLQMNSKIEGNAISAPMEEFSRVVVGIPETAAVASTSNDAKPFIIAAVGFVLAMIVLVTVGSMFLKSRPRIVTTGRRASTHRAKIR